MEFIQYKDSNFFNSQKSLIRINTILHFFSFGFIGTHTLVFCFLSFIGLILIYRTFHEIIPERKNILISIVFLTPSVLIWSSSLFKESLIFLGLGIFVYSVYKKKNKFLFLFSLLILFFVAAHVALIVMFSGLMFYLYQKNNKSLLIVPLILIIGGVLLVKTPYNPLEIIASKMNQQHKIGKGGYYFFDKISKKDFYVTEIEFNRIKPIQKIEFGEKTDYYFLPSNIQLFGYNEGEISTKLASISDKNKWFYLRLHYEPASSYLPSEELEPNIISFICYIPKALYNTLLEPSVFKKQKFSQSIFAFENLLILILLIGIVMNRLKWEKSILIIPLLTFSLIMIILIGFTSPISGNIVRYKSPVVLSILIVILSLLPPNFIPNKGKSWKYG